MSEHTHIDQLITDLSHHLADELGFHTAILYGSHARGDWDAASDIDVMAFRDDAEPTHAAGRWRDVFLDLFVYPSGAEASPDWLRMHGGRVLFQRNGEGDRVLSAVATLYEAGPSLLDPVAAQTRCLWLEKMLARGALEPLLLARVARRGTGTGTPGGEGPATAFRQR